MEGPRIRYARLDEERLGKVRELEGELGTCLVALEMEYRLAELSEEQLQRLQAAEKELGIVLLAYESD